MYEYSIVASGCFESLPIECHTQASTAVKRLAAEMGAGQLDLIGKKAVALTAIGRSFELTNRGHVR